MKYSYLSNNLKKTLLRTKNHKTYRFKCQDQSMYYLFSIIQFVNRNHWGKPRFLIYSQYTTLVTSTNPMTQVSQDIMLRWVNDS